MKLHYAQISEQGAPLICVHGLFGSLDNLGVINKLLAEHFQVWALDLPNHGRSPHIDVMTHRITAESIIEFMDGQRIERASLFGHSLGGKAVMQLALDHPERVEKVVVGDIAPVKSRASHDGIFKAMFSIDLDAIQSRSDADRALANSIDEPVLRSFLLKNLRRNEDGKFQWRINLNGLFEQYHHVQAGLEFSKPFPGGVLFLKGGNSHDHLGAEHQEVIQEYFPAAEIKVIENTGHWLHAEKPTVCAREMIDFIGVE